MLSSLIISSFSSKIGSIVSLLEPKVDPANFPKAFLPFYSYMSSTFLNIVLCKDISLPYIGEGLKLP